MSVGRDGVANLIDLMSAHAFEKALASDPAHPLRVLWERTDSARDHFLATLDRAAELSKRVWDRSPDTARSSLQGEMKKRRMAKGGWPAARAHRPGITRC